MKGKSLTHLADEYIQSLKVRAFAQKTVELKRFRLERFFAFLHARGRARVGAITKAVILDYQTELYHAINAQGRPNGVEYQNSMLAAVKGFMRFLYDRDYIAADPAQSVPYAKPPKRLPRGVLSASEARKLMSAPDTKCVIGYRDKTIMEVLYSTGIRKQEAGSLTLADVDYHDGFLRVNCGKGRKDRVVPLGRIACRYLENYIKSVRPELIRDPCNDHLFLSARGGKLSKNMIWHLVKKYAKKAKLKKPVTPHTFRHSCATGMLKNRADIRSVQELLGHASIESTQIYTRITIDDLKETHKRCHPRERDKE